MMHESKGQRVGKAPARISIILFLPEMAFLFSIESSICGRNGTPFTYRTNNSFCAKFGKVQC